MDCSPKVSTPSARQVRSKRSAIIKIVATIFCCSASKSAFATKERSIFKRCTGKRRSVEMEEWPVPKSPRSILQPSSDNRVTLRTIILSASPAMTLSRTAMHKRLASIPKRSKSQAIFSKRRGLARSLSEKLTPTVSMFRPRSSHFLRLVRLCVRMLLVNRSIWPAFSKAGRIVAGESQFPALSRQRANASNPLIWPVSVEICGWNQANRFVSMSPFRSAKLGDAFCGGLRRVVESNARTESGPFKNASASALWLCVNKVWALLKGFCASVKPVQLVK